MQCGESTMSFLGIYSYIYHAQFSLWGTNLKGKKNNTEYNPRKAHAGSLKSSSRVNKAHVQPDFTSYAVWYTLVCKSSVILCVLVAQRCAGLHLIHVVQLIDAGVSLALAPCILTFAKTARARDNRCLINPSDTCQFFPNSRAFVGR